jgi:excisionase family DNA binding protein
MTETSPGALLTPAQVAVFLSCSVSSVYRWVSAGALPAFRLGGGTGRLRLPFVSVEQFLKGQIGDELAGDATAVEPEHRKVVDA